MSEQRLYGGWRPSRGYGLGRLTERQTLAVTGAVLAALTAWIALTTGLLPLAGFVAVVVILGVFTTTALIPVPRTGLSLAGTALVALRGAWARRRGYTQWQSGPLTEHPRRGELPGVLAATMPIDAVDGLGNPFGLLWDRRTGRLTCGLRLAPVGTVLSDAETTDLWVGQFAEWLSSLGQQPMLQWVAITVETRPAEGTEMLDYVHSHLDPHAPDTARRVLSEIAESHRGATSEVCTRVALSFDPSRAPSPPADTAEAVAEVSRVLTGISNQLALAGVSVLGRVQTAEWTQLIRAAFDPHAAGELSRLDPRRELLEWGEAGPVTAEEGMDHYRHDGAWSASFALARLPQQQVPSSVLAPLLVPGRYHRRVTITYQPIPDEQTGDAAEKESQGAEFRRALRRRTRASETERERADEHRARQAAAEEAGGAGVGFWSCVVTTTVTDPRELGEAAANVESRGRTAKLRLRPCWGWQAAGFAAGLGVGLYPPELSRRMR